jgi:hypothetical protein
MRAPRRVIAAVLPFLVIAVAAADGAGDSRAGGAPFDSPGGLVIARAEARGGHGPARGLRLLLDSGDPGGVTLFASAARALGLPPGPARPGVALGLNGSVPVERRSARLPALTLDGMTWHDLPVEVIERSDSLPKGVGAEVDGVIGAGMASGLRVVIDYAARRLSVGPARDARGPEPGPSGGGASAPPAGRSETLRCVDGRWLTWVDAGGSTLPALIDTASARTLIDRGAARSSGSRGAVRLSDAAGHAASYPAIRVRDLVVGGAAIESADMVEVELGRGLAPILSPASSTIGVVVGADILSGHRVLIDPAAGRFILEPASGRPEPAGRPASGTAGPDASRRPARPPESAGRNAGRRPSRSR